MVIFTWGSDVWLNILTGCPHDLIPGQQLSKVQKETWGDVSFFGHISACLYDRPSKSDFSRGNMQAQKYRPFTFLFYESRVFPINTIEEERRFEAEENEHKMK